MGFLGHSLFKTHKKNIKFTKLKKFKPKNQTLYNKKFTITKKVPVIFHNLRGYDSHLIFEELSKFNSKISVIPNNLEKYMNFSINNNIVFIDSMLFLNSSLDKLAKNLSSKAFKYLS